MAEETSGPNANSEVAAGVDAVATTADTETKDITPNNNDNANTTATQKGNSDDPPPTLSKKQLKRRKRWEKALAVKKRRKEQEKEIRILKAKKEGRDLDAERAQQAKAEKEGKGWARREQAWKDRCNKGKIDESFRVCFDCNFEDQMTWKEVNSLSLQLRYTYAMNRKSAMPVHIDVCSLKSGCDTRKHMEKVDGFPDSWANRAYHCHEGSLEEVFGEALSNIDKNKDEDKQVNKEEGQIDSKEDSGSLKDNCHQSLPKLRPNHQLVYLTGDSEETLSTLDNNTTYIIGGIVDRNRLKRAAIDRAEAIGSNSKLPIKTARLPLNEHLDFKASTRVLTCNHVFEILLKFRENGYQDWGKAVLSVMPDRKDIHQKEKEQSKEENENDN